MTKCFFGQLSYGLIRTGGCRRTRDPAAACDAIKRQRPDKMTEGVGGLQEQPDIRRQPGTALCPCRSLAGVLATTASVRRWTTVHIRCAHLTPLPLSRSCRTPSPRLRADALRRRLELAGWFAVHRVFCSQPRRSTQPSSFVRRRSRRLTPQAYFFFFAAFLFAVFRAGFLAADLVFIFALFAMLPS